MVGSKCLCVCFFFFFCHAPTWEFSIVSMWIMYPMIMMLVTVCAVVFWCNHYGILMFIVCYVCIDHGVCVVFFLHFRMFDTLWLLLTHLMWNFNTTVYDWIRMFVDDRYVWVFFFLHQPGIFKSFESLKCTSVSCIKMLMDMFCVFFFFFQCFILW